jgi:hypothetical protein
LAEAFASTFVWALALMGLAMIPALAMAHGKWRRPEAEAPRPAEEPVPILD